MKKFLLISMILSLSLLMPTTITVLAHEDGGGANSTGTGEVEPHEHDSIEQRLKNREAKAKKSCEVLRARLQAVNERADKVREKRSGRYSRIIERLEKLSSRLDLAGADTTTLNEQIQTLEEMILDFRGSFGEFNAGLLKAAAASCGDKDDLKALINDAKTERNELKEQAREIRDFIRDEIKATLSDIRGSLQSDDATESVEDREQEEGEG